MKRISSKENGVVGISCKKRKEARHAHVSSYSPSKREEKTQGKTQGKNHTTFSIEWKVLFFTSFIEFLSMFWLSVENSASCLRLLFLSWSAGYSSEIDGFFPNLLNIHDQGWKKKQQQQTNKPTKTKKAWKGNFFYIACNLRLFAHSSSSPKRKY